MKYLGLDYGSKRIGVALSNAEGTIAFPRTTLENDASLAHALKKIVEEEKPDAVVIGDTRTLEGGANAVTHQAELFGKHFAEQWNLPIRWVREAGSSVAVSAATANHDDAAAAAFILQRYLDGVQ